MILSIIVAAAENGVIGRDNGMIWKLSADLKRFKSLTTGHTVIMGRKTFESLGRALPNRRNIVISRNPAYRAAGCEMATSVENALKMADREEEVFIIGGGMIYRQMWDQADRLYLTIVHTHPQGDTHIPQVGHHWKEVFREEHPADEKNEFGYTFVDYLRG